MELKRGTTLENLMLEITESLTPKKDEALGSKSLQQEEVPPRAYLSSGVVLENTENNSIEQFISELTSILIRLEESRYVLDERVGNALDTNDYVKAKNIRMSYKALKNATEDLLDAIEFVEHFLED